MTSETFGAREFDQQVKTHRFPALSPVRCSHDHFGSFGTAIYGVNTPELQMADNDYATALLIEKIARSPYANSTLISSSKMTRRTEPITSAPTGARLSWLAFM